MVAGLLIFLAGCNTTRSNTVQSVDKGGSASGLFCSFVSPIDPTEKLEAWMNPVNGLKLKNVKLVQTIGGMTLPGQILSEAPLAGEPQLSNHGGRQLRSWSKAIFDVKYKKFDCFSLESVSARASFLCLAKSEPADHLPGLRSAFWATNISSQRYAKDLTVYETKCQIN
jgi:hypothetical protein